MERSNGKRGGDAIEELPGRMLGPSSAVRFVALSRDGGRLAAAGCDRVVRVWNAETGEETDALGFKSDRINALAFSPNGQPLAAGGGTEKVGEVVGWQVERKRSANR